MTDDIVDTLRRNPLYIPTSRINSFGRPQMGFELTSFNLIAADEIERLRKERDEAIKQRDEARRAVCCSALPSDFKEWKPENVDGIVRLIAAQQGWDCYEEKP